MTVAGKVKGAGALLLAAGLVLVGLSRWTPANEEDGGIEVHRGMPRPARTTPCYRIAVFSANWSRKEIMAAEISWGQIGNSGHEVNVAAPWQKPHERVPCDSTVMLDVRFPYNVNPGPALCEITVNNRTYESDLPKEERHPHCFVQIYVS